MPQETKRGSFRGDVRSRDYTTGPDAHIQNRGKSYVQEGLKKAEQHRKDIATRGVTPGLPPGGTVNSTMSVPPPQGMALPPQPPMGGPPSMPPPMVPPPSNMGGMGGGMPMPMPRGPMGPMQRGPVLGGPPPMSAPPPDNGMNGMNQMGNGMVSPLFAQYLQQLMQNRGPMGRRTLG